MLPTKLILHDKVGEVFGQSQRQARELRYLRGKRGKSMAKDACNLPADGVVRLTRHWRCCTMCRCGAGLKPTVINARWAPT